MITTKEKVRFSYAFVHEPDEKGFYSTQVIIPKSAKKTVKAIKEAVEAVKEANKSKLAGASGKIPANLKTPLRDGDEEDKGPEYEGCYFLNAKTKTKPQIVDRDRNPIMDKSEMYSGVYGFCSLSFYAYDVEGSKGIAAGLGNILTLGVGEPLDGRTTAEDDFADLEFDDEDDLDDLE